VENLKIASSDTKFGPIIVNCVAIRNSFWNYSGIGAEKGAERGNPIRRWGVAHGNATARGIVEHDDVHRCSYT
jgi:hypothetical protein